jgi:hypothetical protein
MASDPIIFAIVAVPAGAYYFISAFREWSHYKTIVNTPTSKVEAIAAGFVEVYGEAIPKGDYLRSPFSGEPCTFYKYTIEEYRSHGKSSSWDVIKKGQSNDPFLVQDETGKIEVDPTGAEFEVVDKKQFKVNPGDYTPPEITNFINTIGMSDNTPMFSLGLIHIGANPRRYTEYVIEKGQNVFVTGTAVPKEGVQSEKHEDMLLIRKGNFNKFFYISDEGEKDILRFMRTSVIFHMGVGGLAALIGLAYIFFRMNIL